MLTLDPNLVIARDYFTALDDPALGRLVAALEEPYRDLALLVRDVGHLITDGWDALTEQQVRDLTLRVATALANPFIETDPRVSGMLVVWLTQRVTALEEERREAMDEKAWSLAEAEDAGSRLDDLESHLEDIQGDADACGLEAADFKRNGIYDLRLRIRDIMDDVLGSDERNFMDADVVDLLRDMKTKAEKVDDLESEVTRLEGQIRELGYELAEAKRDRD